MWGGTSGIDNTDRQLEFLRNNCSALSGNLMVVRRYLTTIGRAEKNLFECKTWQSTRLGILGGTTVPGGVWPDEQRWK